MTTDFDTAPAPVGGPRKTNTLAIVSLVCSVASLLTCCIPNVGVFVCIGLAILGGILGYVALGQIKRTGEQGYGLALAGSIIGAIIAVISIVLIILAFVIGVTALQFLNNPQNVPGGEQPGGIDVFDSDSNLGDPTETPDTSDDIVPEAVPEPVTPGDAGSADTTNDTDAAESANEATSPESANP